MPTTSGKSSYYQHYYEKVISCLEGDSLNFSLIDEEAQEILEIQNWNLMHLGLITIGVKGLVRKQLGTKTINLDIRIDISYENPLLKNHSEKIYLR